MLLVTGEPGHAGGVFTVARLFHRDCQPWRSGHGPATGCAAGGLQAQPLPVPGCATWVRPTGSGEASRPSS